MYFMKSKLLLSAITTVAAAAVVIGGTTAFFGDTETAQANVTTAGSVTLGITNITHTYNGDLGNAPIYNDNGVSFTLDDIKPLDNGSIDYQILNGANEAYVCARVTETGNAENTLVNPEVDLGDTGPAGELQNFLSFKFGTETGTLSTIGGQWQSVGMVSPAAPTNSAINYCFGEYDGGGNCALGAGDENIAQTDSVTMDLDFYAVQTRNNPDFTCADLNNVTVTSANLAVTSGDVVADPTKWLFYNDTNDTVMPLNQFAPAGANDIVPWTGSNGAAYMKLDVAGARYNIATYQFASTPAASITSLKYRVYDASASAQTPFLNFNVSFDGVDGWQKRLVQVPGTAGNPAVPANTWTTVDAIAGGATMWTWSGYVANGNMWPDGNTNEYRSWSDLLAAFPNMKVRDTDSFFGIRVGHPGPLGEESYVDWVEFNGQTYDFTY